MATCFSNGCSTPFLPKRLKLSASASHHDIAVKLPSRGRGFLLGAVMKCSNGYPPISASSQDGLAAEKPLDKPYKTHSVQLSGPEQNRNETTVSITVVGASGDLAKKKIFPALFALFYEDFLPEHFTIFGYARRKFTDEELRILISQTLTCRIDKRENCGDKMEHFLQRCFYHAGQYSSEEDFSELNKKLEEKEAGRLPNRLFYLSIPPNIFIDVVRCATRSAASLTGWTRVIVEKPFGRDSESSAELTRCLKEYLTEDQIFRIDHYLGKELVENLSVLRFSNLVFEPLWSRQYIRNVQLIFSEDFGTEGRGGYFDSYGIIRDIMQNHLLQILALFAMETPGNLYKRTFGCDLDKATNELVIRVQPDEAIYLKINNKIPGLSMRLDRSNLNLLYSSKYPTEIPDAYERLLLDAIEGERRLFIRSDELDAAWALFTPLLKELEEKKIAPELYPYGSTGPVGEHYLAAKYNVRWGDLSSEDV